MSEVNSKQIQQLIDLYKEGNLVIAKARVKQAIKSHPDSFILFNLLHRILTSFILKMIGKEHYQF